MILYILDPFKLYFVIPSTLYYLRKANRSWHSLLSDAEKCISTLIIHDLVWP